MYRDQKMKTAPTLESIRSHLRGELPEGAIPAYSNMYWCSKACQEMCGYGPCDVGERVLGAEASKFLLAEVDRLHKALGEQVEMVRKWKNRESRIRGQQRKLLERFGLTRETMDAVPRVLTAPECRSCDSPGTYWDPADGWSCASCGRTDADE